MVPSPNAQAYATTVPSTSVDPEASKAHASPVHADVNAAVGGMFPPGAAGRKIVCAEPLTASAIPVRGSSTGELRWVVVPSPSSPALL